MWTPNYAPPEQFSDSSTVEASGDVYALAATLYFLLTGKHGVAPGLLYQVMRCICEEPFPDAGADRSDLPDGLTEVLARATAKDPKDRPASAREFGKELSPFITIDDEERADFLKDLDVDRDFEERSALVSPPPLQTIIRIQTQLQSGLQVEVAPLPPTYQGPREETVQVSEEEMAEKRAAALAETRRSSPLLMAVAAIFGIVALVVGSNWAKERGRARNIEDEKPSSSLAKTAELAEPPKETPPEPLQKVAADLGMKFQFVKSGSFMMGSPVSEVGRDADEIQHRVTLTEDFYMATTELTQDQWQKVMGSTPWSGKKYVKNGPNVAASYLSWNDAQEYCATLNKRYPHENWEFRLPTEAEWEYCCRAGSDTAYSFGESASSLGEYAWFENRPFGQYAHLVQQKRSNNWGLFDMHGNVQEWCQVWRASSSSEREVSSKTPQMRSTRICRGGSWSNTAPVCRSAFRVRISRNVRNCYVGFRLVFIPESK